MTDSDIIVRYPPAPSGEIHTGNLRTMLFNFLLARKHDGKIVLRFEDTNEEKSDAKYEDIAIQTLGELNLSYDDGPYRQSDRLEIYQKHLQDLLDRDLAYYAEESNDGSGQVIRFRNPNKEVAFIDAVRDEITIDTSSFEDFIIARSFDSPLYHFTVVVDDMDMGVTHILRGEDHITSTPRQILLIEALGGTLPTYAHLPLIVGEDKKKLGKRHGATGWSEFREQGYLPSGFINHLALLGWNPGDDREIFALDELIKEFSVEKIQKSPATFSYQKLDDINKQHMARLSAKDYQEKVMEFLPEHIKTEFTAQPEMAAKITDLVIKERAHKFGEVYDMAEAGEFDYYFRRPDIDQELIQFKDDGLERGKELVLAAADRLEALSKDDWQPEGIKDTLWDWTAEVGRGSVLHPMRTILSGQKQSPDPFTIAAIVGKTECLGRLRAIIDVT